MLTKTRRRLWLPAVCAFSVLLPAVALNLRSDRATSSDHPQKSASLHERLRYIVQAASSDIARSSVRDVGGLVTSDLSVIRAVGAALNDRELAALRDRGIPHLRIYDDTPVHSSSPAGTLPETYYPSEVDAQTLQTGGMTGRGVTVAVVDSGLWGNQGPLQFAPSGGRSRVLAQYDVVLAREQPGYYAPPL